MAYNTSANNGTNQAQCNGTIQVGANGTLHSAQVSFLLWQLQPLQVRPRAL